ncbi:MAG: S8/S53 family peptidase [Bacilli bacterium]|nr:S8/S53 family peptidase [Bacilli bacterium]
MKQHVFPFLLLVLCMTSCRSTNASSSQSPPSSFASDVGPTLSDVTSAESVADMPSSSSVSSLPDPTKESMYSKQGYLKFVGGVDSIWRNYLGDGQTIAVIDTGFDVGHSEFQNQDGYSKISPKSARFHHEGGAVAIDVGVEHAKMTNGDSHGTFCAAVAAASVTGEGTVGIAPNASLMLLATDSKPRSIAEAFRYAADNGARIITISIGSYSDYEGDLQNDGSDLTSVFDASLEYAYRKGVVICSAGGNGGLYRPVDYTYPGGCDYVIGVGGLAKNSRTTIWSESSRNSESAYQFCDVFAPSEDMFNACNFTRDGKRYLYDGGWNGTSFASPIVAGAAALYFQKHPTHTNQDFERALYNTADSLGGSAGGYGAINIQALMEYGVPEDAEVEIAFESASWWDADGAATRLFAWSRARSVFLQSFSKTKDPRGTLRLWTFNVDRTLFDYLVFIRVSPNDEAWGAETITLNLEDFHDGSLYYSIKDSSPAWLNDNQRAVGNYK